VIKGCREGDNKSQKILYDKYAGLLLAVCRRYIVRVEDAEDVMIEGFYKIFSNLNQYDHRGSFEGWMKRIMVNEALMWLRKRRLVFAEMNDQISTTEDDDDLPDDFEIGENEILKLLDALPDGYKTVFNLYVMEEFKHREIADMLGISINTSKSQLILAKKKLKQLLEAKRPIKKINHE
jgi:RNA polymerase sigma factor (sigma-70 family)